MKRILVFYCLMTGACAMTFAQGVFRPGFIVKVNGDSISGYVDGSSSRLNSYVVFKASINDPKTKFEPGDLKAFGFQNGSYFSSENLEVEKNSTVRVFVEIIIKGPGSLLKYKDALYFKDEKGTSRLESSTYVSLLNERIAECNLKAEAVGFDEIKLTYLIQNYNKCKGVDGIVYGSRNEPWTFKAYVDVYGVLTQSSVSISGFSSDTFKGSTSAAGGVGIDLQLKNHFQGTIELWYGKNFIQGFSVSSQGGTTTRQDILMDMSYWKLPIGLRYNIFKEGRTPYLRAGFVKYSLLNTSYSIRSEVEQNGTILTNYSPAKGDQTGQSGFWFSGGYSAMMMGNFQGFIEFRYEMTNGPVTLDTRRNADYNTLCVIAGIRF